MTSHYHALQQFRKHPSEPLSPWETILETLQGLINLCSLRGSSGAASRSRSSLGRWKPWSFLNIPLGLVLLWMVVLWWGEVASFRHAIADCAWDLWESWVC